MNLIPFGSWHDVLNYAHSGAPIYYKAPMDRYPARLLPSSEGGNAPYTYKAGARTIKIWPAGSVGRGRNRTSDPFSADAGHLERFMRPEEGALRVRAAARHPARVQENRMSKRGIRSYGPGKFNTIIDGYMYELTLDGGADEESGAADEGGWYGFMNIGSATEESIRAVAAEQNDSLTSEEEDLLIESQAAILSERSDGMVAVDWYTDLEEAEAAWEGIVEGEDDDDGDEDDEGDEGDEDDDDLDEEADEEVDEEADLRETPRKRSDRPDDIRVHWDRQDPRDEGWAYNAYWRDEHGRVTHEDSGPIEGRRDMSDATLTSRARAAVGYPGTRIPVEVVR